MSLDLYVDFVGRGDSGRPDFSQPGKLSRFLSRVSGFHSPSSPYFSVPLLSRFVLDRGEGVGHGDIIYEIYYTRIRIAKRVS